MISSNFVYFLLFVIFIASIFLVLIYFPMVNVSLKKFCNLVVRSWRYGERLYHNLYSTVFENERRKGGKIRFYFRVLTQKKKSQLDKSVGLAKEREDMWT